MEFPTEGLHLDPEGLLQVILGEAYNALVEELAQALDNALGAAEQFMQGMERLRLMVKENSRVTQAVLEQEVAEGRRGLGEIRTDLLKYQLQLEEVKAMPAHRWVQLPSLCFSAMSNRIWLVIRVVEQLRKLQDQEYIHSKSFSGADGHISA